MSRMNLAVVADGNLPDLVLVEQMITELFAGFDETTTQISFEITGEALRRNGHELPVAYSLVRSLDLPGRIKNALLRYFGEQLTVGMLRAFSRVDLVHFDGIGKHSLDVIEATIGKLARHSNSITDRCVDVPLYVSQYYYCDNWPRRGWKNINLRPLFYNISVREFAHFYRDRLSSELYARKDFTINPLELDDIVQTLHKAWIQLQPLRGAAATA